MSYHLITGFGASAMRFSNTTDNITGQGVLQGSSSAGPIYILNSDVSLSAYRKSWTAATFSIQSQRHPSAIIQYNMSAIPPIS